jgi:hypothetical protein
MCNQTGRSPFFGEHDAVTTSAAEAGAVCGRSIGTRRTRALPGRVEVRSLRVVVLL